MVIVSNTSPITNLAAIHHLDLIQEIYGEIIIPQAVFQELTQWGDSISGVIEVKTLAWIKTQSIQDFSLVNELENKLDKGESSAIALANW